MENFINLTCGQPPENLLPFRLVAEAAAKLLSRHIADEGCTLVRSPLSYGDNTEFYCQRLAAFLMAEGGREFVNPELLVPTAGISNALDMVTTMMCKGIPQSKQGVVFVEDATYFLSMGIFQDHNLLVKPIPLDKDGVIIEEFRSVLQEMTEEDSHFLPLFFYTIPTFHNPTGRTMPLKRRQEMLALTKSFNVVVVADEVYQLLGFTNYLRNRTTDGIYHDPTFSHSAYPSLVTICPFDGSQPYDHVISVSSFSKILAPGLRVGWAEFSSLPLAQRFKSLGVLRSGSSISHFSSCVAVSCTLGIEEEEINWPFTTTTTTTDLGIMTLHIYYVYIMHLTIRGSDSGCCESDLSTAKAH
jgi:2-aminoadipate transaminase